MIGNSFHSTDSDDMDQFFDAATFSFGSLASSDMPTGYGAAGEAVDAAVPAGVRFNPVVGIMGGCEIPLAPGDGYWDTLQYEYVNTSSIVRGLTAQESVMSLSLGEAFEEKTKAKFNPFSQQESLGSEISFTRDIATVQEEPDEGSWLRASISESSTGVIQDFVRSRIEKADDRDHLRDFAAANANVAMKRESSRKLIGAVFPRRGAASAATQTLTKKVLQHVAIQAIKTANVTVASTASTMAVATVVASMGVMAKLAIAATAVSVVVAGSMLGSSGATATLEATVSNPNETIIASNGSQLLVSKVYSENTTVSQAVKAIEFEALVNVTTLQPVEASVMKKSKTMPPSVYGGGAVTAFPSSSSTLVDEDYGRTSSPMTPVPSNSSSTLTPTPPETNGVSSSERIATKVPLANDAPTVPASLSVPASEATTSPQSTQPPFAILSSNNASKIESTLASPRPIAPTPPELPPVTSPSSDNASKIESTLAYPRPKTPNPTTVATARPGKDSPPLTSPSAQLPSADGSDSMWPTTPNAAPSEVSTEFPSILIKDSPAPLAISETTRTPLIDAPALHPFRLPTPQPSEVHTYSPQPSSEPVGEITDFPSQQGSTKIPSSGPVRPTDAPGSHKPDRLSENPTMTPSWSKSMTPSSGDDRVVNTSRPSNLPTDVPNEGEMDSSSTVPSFGLSDISVDPTPSLTCSPTSLTTELPAHSEHPTAQPSLRPGDDGRAIPSPMPTNVLNGGASSSSAIPSAAQTAEVPEIFLPTDEGSSSPTADQSNFPTLEGSTEFPSPVPDLTASTRPSEAPTEGLGSLSSQNPSSLPSQHYSEVPSSIEDDMLKTLIPSLSPSTSPRPHTREPPMEPPAGISSHSPTQMPSVDISKSESPLSLPPRAPSSLSSSKPSRLADAVSSSPSDFSTNGPSLSPTVIELRTKPTIRPSQTGPSGSMTEFPSLGPTLRPTNLASTQPVNMSPASSQKPSTISSTNPSVYPASLRSPSPIALSSQAPSISPTENKPSKNPDVMPSQSPATGPTTSPHKDGSRVPSATPSEYPTVQSAAPSNIPPVTHKSEKPSPVSAPVQSNLPWATQSAFPTVGTSRTPSAGPSLSPTADKASEIPSMTPSRSPGRSSARAPREDTISQHPSVTTSVSPTKVPVARFGAPSALPSRGPSNDATVSSPSNAPSLASSRPTTDKIIASKPPSRAPSLATSRFPSISPRASQLPTLAARPSSSPSLSPSTQSSDTGRPVSIPTSFAPITESPSTDAPFVTIVPVTNGPATATPFAFAPVTNGPVTAAPLTGAPTTKSPLTFSPVTKSAATNAPLATLAPTTNGPVTVSPIAATPTTKAPTSSAPITKSPTASVPVATQAPAANEPATNIPIAVAPVTNGPVTVAPMNAAPVTKSPTSAAPVTKLPTTSIPLATPSPATHGSVAPMTKSPESSAFITKSPTTNAPFATSAPVPVTVAPNTLAPMTNFPVTQPPATSAPLSTKAAPATNGPVSVAPVTTAPFTTGPVTAAPLTVAPVTKSPMSSTKSPTTSTPLATLAPATNAPVTAAPITIAPMSQSPMSLAPVTKAPLAPASPISKAPITNAPVVTMAPVVPMCTLQITAPLDIMVQILEHNNVTLRNAETIIVQSNVNIHYRVVGGREIFGNWTVHAVGTCASPLDVTAAVSTVTFIVPQGNVTVDVWLHTGKFYNGDSLNVPLHSTFEWRVQSDPDKLIFNNKLNLYHVGATGGIVNATPFVCTVTFKVPIDFSVEIQQTGHLYRNGDSEFYPNHSGMSWRIRLDSGLVGGWQFHSIGNGGELDAIVATTLVPIVAIPNTQVNLKDHWGWLLNGDSVRLPLGVNVTWETVEGHPATFSVVRNTHFVTLGSVLNVAAFTCALTNQAPANITVALNAYPGASFFGSDVVILAANTTLQWRTSSGSGSASSSSIVGPWNTRAVDDCAIPLDTISSTCALTIFAATNSEIDVRNRATDLVHGASVLLPKNSTIEWRVKTNTFFGAYTTHEVGHCGTPLDTFVSVCNLTVNTAPMGGHVEVFGWPHNLGMGAILQLPRDRIIFYRVRINGLAGPELSHNVGDCLVPLETAPNSCQTKVTGLPSASSWVDVPPQLTNLRTGDTFALPKDVTFNWTAHSSGVAATKTSNANGTTCTELDASSAFL